MTSPSNCLIVGLDGAIPELVEKYAGMGLLPNIQKLIRNGAWAENCLPPLPNTTPTCWATIATGASPGTHGVTSANLYGREMPLTQTHRHKGYESQSTEAETLWEAAERAGIDSLLVSYPTSWPPKTRGVQIGTTDTSATDGSFGIKHQLFSTEAVPGSIGITLRRGGDNLTASLIPDIGRGKWTVEEMLGQARSGGPAEIHSDIESVWFNCEGESFLRFSYEFCYLQKFLVISLVKRGYVTGWSN